MERLEPGDPRHVGAYRLLGRLGAGGMGQVYLARSDRGRTAAVKLVREELAAREEFRARFRQEVRAARRVGGHWTAPVLDADTEAAVPWVATGYVAGPSLQRVVGHDHGPLPERSVRVLAAGLAHALKDIHAAGIVHRDLKPSNVLVTIDGPRVIDFGIARALETVTEAGLTSTGVLVGSPGFMAPEQVRGEPITPACDIFCLGSVLVHAATGALPFGSADSGIPALMFRIAQEEPHLDGVPEGIADLVRACLRKDPAARPTLDEILDHTGAEHTVTAGRTLDPWLPSPLVAQLGRHAVRLLETENPEGTTPGTGVPAALAPGGAGGPAGARGGTGGTAGSAAPAAPAPAAPAGGAVPAAPTAPTGAGAPAGAGGPGARDGSAVPAAAGGPARSGSPGTPGGPGPHAPGAPGAAHTPGTPATPGAPTAPAAHGPGGPVPPDHFPTPTAGHPAISATPPPAHPAAPATPRTPPAHGAHPTSPAPAAAAPSPGTPPHQPYGYPHPLSGTPQHAYGGSVPQGYGHPSQGYGHPPQSAGQGYPPPYGVPPASAVGPYGGGGQAPPPAAAPHPAPPPRRNGKATALLVAVAVVVALAAGGTVYALMNGGGDTKASPSPSPTSSAEPTGGEPTGSGRPTPSPSPSVSASAREDGAVPAAYLGAWATTIENADGTHTRRLTIQQGEPGDTVMSLTADGADYHCVFAAELTAAPAGQGPLRIGPSTVTVGEPRSSCSPGEATEITLLSPDTLQRLNTSTGEKLTYTRQ
ncbi:serine/threonine-protein kinase [Streptomyces sp. JB150]|uniref:serine/threonine-protein kinase n=1 Tax=Streptomyces sp. JB150 TaxID=2714844 RepID=UPI00140D01A7|nr:serine/threonine-protein kinase [Streptomyces sp. JB150]QIJ66646.1 serine/threonine protein kinase [Streptomyces sp. JB150]